MTRLRADVTWDPLEAPEGSVLGPVYQARFASPAGRAHVLVVGDRPDLLEDARSRVVELGRAWSTSRRGSDLSRLISAAAHPPVQPLAVSPETLLLLGLAKRGQAATSGRFRPFADAPAPLLDARALTAALPPHGRTHLYGFAAAVCADLVAQDAIDAGAQGVCVNVSGQVRISGVPPRPAGWEIGTSRDGEVLRLFEGGMAGTAGSTAVASSAWHAYVLAVAAAVAPASALDLLAVHGAEGRVDDPPQTLESPGWPALLGRR